MAAVLLIYGGRLGDWGIRDKAPSDVRVGVPRWSAFSPFSLTMAAEFLLNPRLYTPRIYHELVPADGLLHHRVRREFTLPGDESIQTGRTRRYYVPLVFAQRGELIGRLVVRSDADARAMLVPYPVASELTFLVLCMLTELRLDSLSQRRRREGFKYLSSLKSYVMTDGTYRFEPTDPRRAVVGMTISQLSRLGDPGDVRWAAVIRL